MERARTMRPHEREAVVVLESGIERLVRIAAGRNAYRGFLQRLPLTGPAKTAGSDAAGSVPSRVS